MPKIITPAQALERLMNSCTRYETCSFKALQKMHQWRIDKTEQQEILQQLVNRHFIDDSRYACNFARQKSQYGKWGAQKIKAHLQQQRLSNEIIAQALQEVDTENEPAELEKMLRKKLLQIKAKSNAECVEKLLRFAVGKGYRYSTAMDAIKQILADKNK
jgi:regulatory protein